jgi:hypothetical protein
MSQFFDAILTFPTSVFSGLLALVLLYWTTVLLGLVDLDLIDLDVELPDVGDPSGALEAGVEAGVEAGLEGADGVDLDGEPSSGGLAGALNVLGLAGVPLTISLSLVIVASWLTSYLVTGWLAGRWPGLAASAWIGILVGGFSLAVGLVAARPVLKPLRRVFATALAARRTDFIGRLCTVTTLKVTARFGQAEIEDGGAGQLVQVRCEEPNELTRGDQALLFDYRPQDEVYLVVAARQGLAEPRS